MSELVVEIHVPLTPSPMARPGDDAYPWIETIEDYLAALDGESGRELDDGEELGDEYLFFVTGASEKDLLAIARAVAALDGVPSGVFALVTDDEAEMGQGRRVML